MMRELDLGAPGEAFLAERLGDGKTLSRLLLAEVARRGASVVTVWPAGVATEKASEPQWGGLPPGTGRGQLEWMRAEVTAHVTRSGDAIGLFENNLARPGDPWVQRIDATLWRHGDEVYHPIVGTPGPEAVAAILRDAERPWLVGALGVAASLPDGREPLAEVSADLLELVATASEVIALSAYDEEGYLLARLGTL